MDSVNWSKEHLSVLHTSEDSFIQLARDAKHPFQFIANVLSLEGNMDPTTIPVTQDASSSAYQIMSYLLLDVDLAMRTSLIPSEDDLIKDVYSFFLEELKPFLQKHLDPTLSTIVCSRLTRKLVKAIFMPMIYGKTVISTARDIHDDFSSFRTHYYKCVIERYRCLKNFILNPHLLAPLP